MGQSIGIRTLTTGHDNYKSMFVVVVLILPRNDI